MQTLKTCGLTDEYKHVCFKDLEDYLKKDDYLAGYSAVEKDLVKRNLSIIDWNNAVFDSKLNLASENAVQNKVLCAELIKKLDLDNTAKVAISGDFNDLYNRPISLPNGYPFMVEGLIDKKVQTVSYFGNELVKITLPTKLSDYPDYSNVIIDTDKVLELISVKGISVNGINQVPSSCGIVDILVPTKISQLTNDTNYITLEYLNSTLTKYKVVINELREEVTSLNTRVAALENK